MPWWFWILAVIWSMPIVMIIWMIAWFWWDDRQCEKFVADAEKRAEALVRQYQPESGRQAG